MVVVRKQQEGGGGAELTKLFDLTRESPFSSSRDSIRRRADSPPPAAHSSSRPSFAFRVWDAPADALLRVVRAVGSVSFLPFSCSLSFSALTSPLDSPSPSQPRRHPFHDPPPRSRLHLPLNLNLPSSLPPRSARRPPLGRCESDVRHSRVGQEPLWVDCVEVGELCEE